MLKLDKHIKGSDFEKYYDYDKSMSNDDKLKYLRNVAKKKQLSIIMRKGNFKEFTIFIYDKAVKPTYLVGYDGTFSTDYEYNFDYCFNAALDYIIKY